MINFTYYMQAIRELTSKGFSLTYDENEEFIIKWADEDTTGVPTHEEIMAKLEQIKPNLEAINNRIRAYPSLQSQMDTLFHEGYDGWKKKIQDIKNLYPKS